jgi:hypothetical protein
MATGFRSLCHHGIQTSGLHNPGIFDGSDHGDDFCAVAMTRLNHLHARIAQAHAEERHALLQNDLKALGDQVGQLGRVLGLWRESQVGPKRVQGGLHGLHELVGEVGRPHGRTDFGREEEVYPKGLIRLAPDGTDRVTQLLSSQQKTGKDAEAACVGDGGREIRPGNASHAGLEERIVNAKKITEPGVENRARC